MKKVLNIILLGIPYLANAVKVAKEVRGQLDKNRDGKLSMEELKEFVLTGSLTVTYELDEKN